jgi:ATP-dependent DNA ligase
MTGVVPELSDVPVEGVFDGELIAFADGQPYFPLVCDRLLHGDRTVSLTFAVFDILELDGEPTMGLPCRCR